MTTHILTLCLRRMRAEFMYRTQFCMNTELGMKIKVSLAEIGKHGLENWRTYYFRSVKRWKKDKRCQKLVSATGTGARRHLWQIIMRQRL